MDIVTHALMGTALVSGAFAGYPLEASTFVLGCVLPDADALSRFGGRCCFLRSHQTWTHSIPLQLAAGLAASGAMAWAGWSWPHLPLVLAAGAAFHALLDATNTFGVLLLWPFSSRRQAWEWIFFIDAGCLALTLTALALAGPSLAAAEPVAPWIPVAYLGALIAYWSWRAQLRRRAGAMAPPGTLSLVPSALWPRRFYGAARREDRLTTYTLDLGSGEVSDPREHQLLDDPWAQVLEELTEFRTMRRVSPAYHVTATRPVAEGTWVECRDLRTRNFGGDFGRLEVLVTADGPGEVVFHV